METVETSPEVVVEDNSAEALTRFVQSVEAKDRELVDLKLDKYSLGPWSISKLKMLRKCPLNFYLKYVLKVKVPADVTGRQDTVSADVGSAAHLILEHVMSGKDIRTAYRLARKEYGPDKLTDEQWAEKVGSLEMNIISFKERMDALGRRHKIKRIFTELRVAVNKDWEPTGFFAPDCYIRGVVDLIVQLENGDIIITDHKTGGGQGSLKPYEDQLNSYKILFHAGVEPITGAQSMVHFIGAGEIKSSYYSTRDEIENKLKGILDFDIEGAIDAVKEIGYWKHVASSSCKWCDYSAACKSEGKLLKPLELSTKRFFELKKVD